MGTARAISTMLCLAVTIACGRTESSSGSATSHSPSSAEPGRLDGAGVAIDAGIERGGTVSLVDVVLALYDLYASAQLRAQKPLPPSPDDCGEVRVTVTADGVVLHRDDQASAHALADHSDHLVPRVSASGPIDRDAVGVELGPPSTGCFMETMVSVAAEDEVPYEDVIDVMDAAVQAGYMPDLDVGFEGGAPDGDPLQVPPDDVLRRAPSIVIRPDALLVEGVVITSDLEKDVTLAVGPVLARLYTRTNVADGFLIIQADRRTPARVVKQVQRAALEAGFGMVLHAAKQRR